jgi:hypothetical protein
MTKVERIQNYLNGFNGVIESEISERIIKIKRIDTGKVIEERLEFSVERMTILNAIGQAKSVLYSLGLIQAHEL